MPCTHTHTLTLMAMLGNKQLGSVSELAGPGLYEMHIEQALRKSYMYLLHLQTRVCVHVKV